MTDFEQISVDAKSAEVQFTRSDYSQVIFQDIDECYTSGSDVDVLYTITRYFSPSSRDWIGLYKVGWTSASDHLYYHWAVIPENYQPGTEHNAKLTFSGKVLPDDDGEFYQFCYVTSTRQVRGASTPFQFKHPSSYEFVEQHDADNDILVVKSRTLALEDQLQEAQRERDELSQQRDRLAKECDGYVTKLMELESHAKVEQQEREVIKVDLLTTQDKVASLHGEVKEKTASNDILRQQYAAMKEKAEQVEAELAKAEERCEELSSQVKTLQNRIDELSGKNQSLEDEMSLYKDHFMQSSHTLKEHSVTLETLQREKDVIDDERAQLRRQIEQLQLDYDVSKRQVERQQQLGLADKHQLTEQSAQLQSLREQVEALHQCKLGLGQQLDSTLEANTKLADDLQESKSELHELKARWSEAKKTHDAMIQSWADRVKELEAALNAKTDEHDKLAADVTKLRERLRDEEATSAGQGSMFALQTSCDVLKRRLAKQRQERETMMAELQQLRQRTSPQTAWRDKQHDLERQVDDLKERLAMGRQEYHNKALECLKLHEQVKKLQKVTVYNRDNTSSLPSVTTSSKTTETTPKCETEVTTQTTKTDERTSTTQTTKAEERTCTTQTKTAGERTCTTQTSLVESADLTSDEMQAQLKELDRELEVRYEKNQKYKKLYADLRERCAFQQRHYHDELERKDAALADVTRQLHELRQQQLDAQQLQIENDKLKTEIVSLNKMLVTKPSKRQAPAIPPRQSTTQTGDVSAHASAAAADTSAATSPDFTLDLTRDHSSAVKPAEGGSSRRSPAATAPTGSAAQRRQGTPAHKMELSRGHSSVVAPAEGASKRCETPQYGRTYAGHQMVEKVHSMARQLQGDAMVEPILPDIRRPPATAAAAAAAAASDVREFCPLTGRPTGVVAVTTYKQADGGSSTEPSAPRMPRNTAVELAEVEEQFYDAENGTGGPPHPPPERAAAAAGGADDIQCQWCPQRFAPHTDAAIVNAHANTHFTSLTASAPEAEAPVVVLQPEKTCPMCGLKFPGDSDKHAQYEEHVQSHFQGENA